MTIPRESILPTLAPGFHYRCMEYALEVAKNCRDIQWYGVGCVIVSGDGAVAATGYTGEREDEHGGMRHAEDVAIEKAKEARAPFPLDSFVLYSTLEPCSVRASGKTPCVERIVDAGIGAVVYGAKEPFDPALKIVCEGERVLMEAGVEVLFLGEYEKQCLESVVSNRIRG